MSIALSVPALLAIALVFGLPVLAFLLLEQHVASASSQWQRRIFLELPVVTEQLGMLLAAGWSLGAAMSRIADRGAGSVFHRSRRGAGSYAPGFDRGRCTPRVGRSRRC